MFILAIFKKESKGFFHRHDISTFCYTLAPSGEISKWNLFGKTVCDTLKNEQCFDIENFDVIFKNETNIDIKI